jgi:bifunctional enzyme CysN/CysC
MAAQATNEATEIAGFLARESQASLLRFITCGSVDDGKSTLIGRLLYESKLLFEDQLATLEADSKRVGTQGGALDFALLVDGLAAEREQGITIDVAYRFFATERRKFIVADTPGHEQYTRNMATGASTCDLAVILVDARKGVLTQTRRHSVIVSLLGVRHIVLAVNKMDLVGYSELNFARIERDYRAFAESLGFQEITCIPVSALKGDNVVTGSAEMPWYRGPALLDHLENVVVDAEALAKPFRLPVQWVNRPNADFRGYAGLVASGVLWPGDRVRAMPSGREARVERIVTQDGDLPQAQAGQSVTLVLDDEIDISRGDVICTAAEPASAGQEFEAKILWMSESALQPGQSYLMKIGTKVIGALVAAPGYALDINTLGHRAVETLQMNETGLCRLTLDQVIAFDCYKDNRETGAFILIDRLTNDTVAMGFLDRMLGLAVKRSGAPEAPSKDGALPRPEPWQVRWRNASIIVFGRRLSLQSWATGTHERPWRSFGKAVSWRAVGTIDTMILAFIFTGNTKITLSIGFTELLTKTLLYFFHERIWARIRFGLRHRND